jgi:hypothetical protein
MWAYGAMRWGYTREEDVAWVLGITPATVRRERILDKARKFEHEWVDNPPLISSRLPRVFHGRIKPPSLHEVELTDPGSNLAPGDNPQPPAVLELSHAAWSRLHGRCRTCGKALEDEERAARHDCCRSCV